MKDWKHDPLTAQNPLKFLATLNALSEQVEALTTEVRKLSQTKRIGRPRKEEPKEEDN